MTTAGKRSIVCDRHVYDMAKDRQGRVNLLRTAAPSLSLQQFIELMMLHGTVPREAVLNFKPTTQKPGRPRLAR